MKLIASSDGTQEQHFVVCLYLMLLFFFVDMGTSALVALHITTMQIGGGEAHDAYIAFFGIALGIFRGMTPQGGEFPPNADTKMTTETKVVSVSPPTDTPKV
jgi:hypothetical protein